MGNQLRYRSGIVQLVRLPVLAGTVIEAGDLVYWDGTSVKPAGDFAWTTNLATTQASFAASFAGVAHEVSAAGETEPISVDVSALSVYEFDAVTGTHRFGAAVAPAESSAHLASQQLAAVAVATSRIGRVIDDRDHARPVVRVRFHSSLAH